MYCMSYILGLSILGYTITINFPSNLFPTDMRCHSTNEQLMNFNDVYAEKKSKIRFQ